MTRDELEYAISQYLDGVLPELERAALEERLAGDSKARAILAEYQKLDGMIKSSMPVPEIAWDQFATQVRQALADEATPVRHFSIGAMGWTRRLAIAAAILLGLSLAVYFIRTDPAQNNIITPQGGMAVIAGPSIAAPIGPVVQEITIGPAPNLANQFRASEEIIVRPTIVQIDRGNSSGQDGDVY